MGSMGSIRAVLKFLAAFYYAVFTAMSLRAFQETDPLYEAVLLTFVMAVAPGAVVLTAWYVYALYSSEQDVLPR